MAEHFCETPEEMKAFGDLLFLSGANRLYFHCDALFAGFRPMAGVDLLRLEPNHAPQSAVARHGEPQRVFRESADAARGCAAGQRHSALLARTRLVVRPRRIPDQADRTVGMDGLHRVWPLAKRLRDAGYSFDYVSDPFLSEDIVSRYKAIVVPRTKFMKKAMLEKLKTFSHRTPVIFEKSLPETVPGLSAAALNTEGAPNPVADAVSELAKTGATRDGFAASDTPFDALRMSWRGGRLYFIVNSSTDDAALSLPDGAVAMNPMSGTCETASPENDAGAARTLPPAHSLFVFLKSGQIGRGSVPKTHPKATIAVGPRWTIEFVKDVSGW